MCSASACCPSPRSVLASTGTGANAAGGPSGLGESTAFERSSPRNWSARYSSAMDAPLQASSMVQAAGRKTFFRTIRNLLNKQRSSKGLFRNGHPASPADVAGKVTADPPIPGHLARDGALRFWLHLGLRLANGDGHRPVRNQTLFLHKFDRRYRPLSVVTRDRDSQPMVLVKRYRHDCSRFSVGENHASSNQLRLRFLQRMQNQ